MRAFFSLAALLIVLCVPASVSLSRSAVKLPGVTEFVCHTAIASLSSLIGKHAEGSKAEASMLEQVRQHVEKKAEEDVAMETIRALWAALRT